MGTGVADPISILGLLLGLCAAVPAWSKFLVETSSLTITLPESLKGSYDSAIGNFGVPQYGGTMAGTVVYPTKQADGCTPFSESFRGPDTGGRPVFALLDRGGNILCYISCDKILQYFVGMLSSLASLRESLVNLCLRITRIQT